jgi:NAD+ synthase (glutamine-hydrolysing)
MMMKSEFKRWQSPPVLKVSDHAFGRGRRFPVAHIAKG